MPSAPPAPHRNHGVEQLTALAQLRGNEDAPAVTLGPGAFHGCRRHTVPKHQRMGSLEVEQIEKLHTLT